MTTLAELKGLFDSQYNRQCRQRQIPPELIGAGEFKLWYDIVTDRIYNDLNIEDASTTIALTPVTVFTEYALPTAYAGLRGYEIAFSNSARSLNNLDIVPIGQIPRGGSLATGIPNKMAIYAKSDGKYYVSLYPLVANSGTLYITYKRNAEIANSSGTGTSLTGAIELPRTYHHLLLKGLLAQVFPDLETAFILALNKAIYDRPIPSKSNFTYNLGGLEDDDIDNGFSKNFNGEV